VKGDNSQCETKPLKGESPVRYAAIVLFALLTLSWKPAHATAMPGQETGGDAKAASPRPNPDASGKYHIGDGVTAPKLISSVDPEFTAEARHKKLQGVVVVALTVDTAGKPQDVRVARSMAEDVSKKDKQTAVGLDEKAVEAVKQYRFEAGQFQGKPVPVEIEVHVNFRIY
jgi:TonB family protein